MSTPPDLLGLLAHQPVFDARVDSLQRQLDIGHDLGTQTRGHLDLVRGRRGGLGSVVLVNWVDPKHITEGPGAARRRTRDLLTQFYALADAPADQVACAGNGALLHAAHTSGRIAGIPGIEGGDHSIEESLADLGWCFEHGVRVLTLVWNNHLDWIWVGYRSVMRLEVLRSLVCFSDSVLRLGPSQKSCLIPRTVPSSRG